MNTKTYILLTIVFLVGLLLLAGSQTMLAQDSKLASLKPVSRMIQTDTTLDICIYGEPPTLYLYGDETQLAYWVLSAVYDGPVDHRDYSLQPVILENIPTLDNGLAITETVAVTAGDRVVDAYDSVVDLSVGNLIRPPGCYSTACAITYTGGVVDMERMVVTHTLLADLAWSDGAALTANDMLYSYELAADPATPSSDYDVERTASYVTTTLTQTQWIGLPGFTPFDYSEYFWQPLPEHAWGSLTPAQLITATVSSRMPMGWGPYVIYDWQAGSHISLYRNPYYFRAAQGLPRFDYLIYHFYMDTPQVLSGECDLVAESSYDLGALLSYDDAGLLEVAATSGATWEHMDFGIQSADVYTGFAAITGAFQDVRVRHALAYCTDRQGLNNAIYYGLSEVWDTLVPASHPFYPPDAAVYPYDPVAGGLLLDAAGWIDTDGDGIRDRDGVPFDVTYKTTTATLRRTVVSMIASDLAACGIQVTPIYLPPAQLFEGWPGGPLFGRKFDLGEFAWVMNSRRPSCNLYLTSNIPSDTNPGGQNNPGYSSPAYDAACLAADSSITLPDQTTYYREAARIFSEELPVLPLFQRLKVGVAAPHITGFTPEATDNTLWYLEELGPGVGGDIPTGGGTLASPGDATFYVFASGTFTSTVVVTHTPVSPFSLPGFGGLAGAGHYFELAATLNGQPVQPSQPFTMTIEYTPGELDYVVEESLGLYFWNGAAWELEPTSLVDPQMNTITATPGHFSYWALLGETNRLVFAPVIQR